MTKSIPTGQNLEQQRQDDTEQLLRDGETRAEFIQRGLAAIARSEAAGDWIPAEQVIAKLQGKVDDARERRAFQG